MPKYPIVLFDADNTLFDFYRAEREALCEALTALDVTVDAGMVAAYSAINEGFWKKLECGEISKSELRVARFAAFFDSYGIQRDVERMARTYTDILSTKGHLLPDALSVCQTLAKHCRLHIITNGISSVQRGRFEPSVLRDLFCDMFVSEELGFEKPRREYFEAVAAAIPGFSPEKALVIGDSLTSDIKGGIYAGIDTCWYNPKGKEAPADMPITYVVSQLKDVIPLVLGE